MMNAKLFGFGGFDMQWSYYGKAGTKAACCPRCGVRVRKWERPYKAKTKKLPYDFNNTYEDKRILSARAKAHFDTFWPKQMSTRQIFENAWEAEPARVLKIKNKDEVTEYSGKTFLRGEESFDGRCPECNLWYCHTHKSRIFSFSNASLIERDGIFRTDLLFGHAFRGPLWLAGPRAAFAISANFREVWLRPIEKMDDGSWRFDIAKPFRVDPAPGAVEPTYPEYLE